MRKSFERAFDSLEDDFGLINFVEKLVDLRGELWKSDLISFLQDLLQTLLKLNSELIRVGL